MFKWRTGWHLMCFLLTCFVSQSCDCKLPLDYCAKSWSEGFSKGLQALSLLSHAFGTWGCRDVFLFTLAKGAAFIDSLASYAQQVDLYFSVAAWIVEYLIRSYAIFLYCTCACNILTSMLVYLQNITAKIDYFFTLL